MVEWNTCYSPLFIYGGLLRRSALLLFHPCIFIACSPQCSEAGYPRRPCLPEHNPTVVAPCSWRVREEKIGICCVEYIAIQNYLNKTIGLGLLNEELALALPWLGGAVDAEATPSCFALRCLNIEEVLLL